MTRDNEVLLDLFDLVAMYEVRLETIEQWTDEEYWQAEQWAHAVHLKASDNDVEVPPVPVHVKACPQSRLKL